MNIHRWLCSLVGVKSNALASSSTEVVVLDTNVLVARGYAPGSSSGAIIEACLNGRLRAIVSDQLQREYDAILPRSVRRPGWMTWYQQLLAVAVRVSCDPAAYPVPGDPDDSVVLATAVAGGATIVTNDVTHLLPMDGRYGVRVVRPSQFWKELNASVAPD